jgi:hypothetical protein
VNIVAVVQRLEADRIWIKANGAGDVPVGWVNKKNAILLDDAIPYFTSLIDHNPKDWDATPSTRLGANNILWLQRQY